MWARRIGQNSWQFPQGGIDAHETPTEALYRELKEEVGLQPEHVQIIASTEGWLSYLLPKRYVRFDSGKACIGQKQKWFMLELVGEESHINLEGGNEPAEFDHWKWVSYWYPLSHVVEFKRDVYQRALTELSPQLFAKLKS